MINVVFGGIEFGATLIEAYFGLRINSVLLTDEKRKPKQFLVAALLLTMIIQLMNHHHLFSVITSAAAVAGWTVATVLICRTDLFESMISSILYMILIYVIDFFSVSMWGLIFMDRQFAIRIISEYSVYRVVHIIFCKWMLFMVWLLFFNKLAGRIAVPVKKMSMAVCCGIAVIWYLGSVTFDASEMPMLVIWCILFLVILAGICFLREYGKWKESRNEYELAAQRNQWIAENYQQNQLFYHNLNNHYLVIKGFLNQKEYEKAEAYIGQMGEAGKISLEQLTGNETLDILLNQKIEIAHRESIDVEILPAAIRLSMTGEELTILFGNALDNAIEACRKVEKERRWIRFQMKQVNDMYFFKITNPLPNDFCQRNEEWRTTKENRSRHGLGIISMKLIAEKYGGIVETSIIDEEFVLMVSFFE